LDLFQVLREASLCSEWTSRTPNMSDDDQTANQITPTNESSIV